MKLIETKGRRIARTTRRTGSLIGILHITTPPPMAGGDGKKPKSKIKELCQCTQELDVNVGRESQQINILVFKGGL